MIAPNSLVHQKEEEAEDRRKWGLDRSGCLMMRGTGENMDGSEWFYTSGGTVG